MASALIASAKAAALCTRSSLRSNYSVCLFAHGSEPRKLNDRYIYFGEGADRLCGKMIDGLPFNPFAVRGRRRQGAGADCFSVRERGPAHHLGLCGPPDEDPAHGEIASTSASKPQENIRKVHSSLPALLLW
ncbi:hypothetical protein GQ600_3255 [Phytophthora cactorum]|nr:hypothetical protein GQ600_3255 [Phytophthora cactorum]